MKQISITCYNFFTSRSLAEILKSSRTSIVVTTNKTCHEIPSCLKQAKEELYSTLALKKKRYHFDNISGKAQKNFLLLNTMHLDIQIESDTKTKRDVVQF